LISWSTACMAKFQVMNSHTGFRPAMAAPTDNPVNPACTRGGRETHEDEPWKGGGHEHIHSGNTHLCDGRVLHPLRPILL
jgi:hypothetical protein